MRERADFVAGKRLLLPPVPNFEHLIALKAHRNEPLAIRTESHTSDLNKIGTIRWKQMEWSTYTKLMAL